MKNTNLEGLVMRKVKKFLKFSGITCLILFCIALILSLTFFHATTHGIALDENKLQITNTIDRLKIYDSKNKLIKPTSSSYIKLSKLSKDTKNAFICAEDKRFYKHRGLDFIRIGGAILSNLKTKSFSEGASTISQQLVKNTQLSNEKTISRKLKEIKLTHELESKYTKDEILELYLNNIYFGNGCYGIENASQHYFGKSADKLSLSESALLAGSINAPSIYDIEKNPDQTKERRNLILSLMKKYNSINNKDFNQAINENIKLNIKPISGNSSIYQQILKEASNILNINEKQIINNNYKIYSQLDQSLHESIKTILQSYSGDFEKAIIIIDNKTHNIIAHYGKNTIIENTWQPGSLIKPILVYAPAIDKVIIDEDTKLLDEKINIGGYSPENADKKYHGFISSKTALSNSYNIPAVKLLNELGISEAKSFAQKLGINFSESDNHLALALGGFEKGVTIKSLCDAYSAFARDGKFQESSFISKITKNDKTIFEKQNNEKQVMKNLTAKQINNMLQECTKNGTAKRLSNLNFEICSKTGTVGKNNSQLNTLAYNVSYTTSHTIITMLQSNNLPANINGSTYPTMINKDILSELYKSKKPENFSKNQNKIKTSTSSSFDSETNYTDKIKTQKDFQLSAINIKNHKPILYFTLTKNYEFFLIRKQKNKEETIASFLENDNKTVNFTDKSAKNNEIYNYQLKIHDKTTNNEFFSNEIKLKTY